MKKILLVAPFTQLPEEKGNNRSRFKRIAEMLAQKGYEVTVVTSRFRELDRTFRKDEDVFERAPYRIVLLDEIGYKRNISVRRILSMSSFTRSLRRFLKTEAERYDLVYTCVPGLGSSLVAGKYARDHAVPFVIDVQDLWPEAMYALFLDIPVISNILFLPFQLKADKVYALADGIMAVSKTYMDVAAGKNKKCRVKDYVFIGTDLAAFDKSKDGTQDTPPTDAGVDERDEPQAKPADTPPTEPPSLPADEWLKPSGEFRIAYIGSIGHSYDIRTLLDGARIAGEKGVPVRPVIIGNGPLEAELKEYARKINSKALFPGWMDHALMKKYLENSDAVINAIKRKAPQSITNKVGDYLASGKPMLNGSRNLELKALLTEYHFGMNYEPENPESLAAAIERLYHLDAQEKEQLGRNARRLAEEKFDRKVTYPRIIGMVDQLLGQE